MTVVNPKSISGINSITMASGSDNLLTIHSNNTTERVRVDSSGNLTATSFSGDGSSLTGVASTENIRTNTNATFLQNVTVVGTSTVTGNVVPSSDSATDIGTNSVRFQNAYVDTYYGDGSNLTGISAGVSLSGSTDNTVCTVTGANAIQGESNVIIDSTGRLLVGTGHGTSRDVGDVSSKIQIEGAGYNQSSFSLMSNAGASAGNTPHLTLGKSRGSSNGDNTIVADDDGLGQIQFAGADGTDCNSVAALIKASVDGAPGSNDMPGRLEFKVTADGAASPTERMRIHSSGVVSFNNGIELGSALDATAANTLDDYEEGTFTPTARGNNTNSSPLIEGSGKYTKIGNVVQIQLAFANENGSYLPGGEYLQIHGLPFTFNGEHFIPYGFNYKVVFNSSYQYLFYSPSGNTRLDGYINVSDSPYTPWGTDQWDNTQWYHSNSFSYLTS